MRQRLPVVLPIGSLEVFLDDLLSPRQSVSVRTSTKIMADRTSFEGWVAVRRKPQCAAEFARTPTEVERYHALGIATQFIVSLNQVLCPVTQDFAALPPSLEPMS